MKAPFRSRKVRLLLSPLPLLLLAVAGCTDDSGPREIFIETVGNLFKGLIDVAVAGALGN